MIGIDKALRLIGISRTLYQEWLLEARFSCTDSFTSLCVKRHPHQLAAREIFMIRNMLTDPEMRHWPIVSIAGLALRKKKMVASLYSWCKYARLLDITKKSPKKDRKTVGLVSNKPNEYLHVDTTYYALSDETRVCLTFVMDNYSKMILGYEIALQLSFAVVMHALSKAIEVIKSHPDQQPGILVADGGKENHNKEIDAFISKLSGYTLTKIRALKDIRFSNSPVEAIHRTIKSRYLRNRRFDSVQALRLYLDWAVKDYNTIRPHYKHRPRTPSEVYFNQPLGFDVRQRVKEAIKKRVQKNRCSQCVECSCK